MQYTAQTTYLEIAGAGPNDMNEIKTNSLLARGSFAAIVIALAISAGLFIPIAPRLLDILLVCSFSLTFAVILTCVSAKRASELGSFAGLVTATTLLRMAINTASARMILSDASVGTIIETAARPVIGTSPWPMIFLIITIAITAMIAIIAFARRINNMSDDFAIEILPMKQADIEARHSMGSSQQPDLDQQQQQLQQETRFYLSIAVASRLFCWDAIICFAIMSAIAVGSKAAQAMGIGPTVSNYSPSTLSYLFGGMIVALLPAIIIASSANSLVKKMLAANEEHHTEEIKQSRKVTIVSPQDGKVEQVDLLNPDFITTSETCSYESSARESIATFEPIEQSKIAQQQDTTSVNQEKYTSIENYYGDIAAGLSREIDANGPIILAAESVSDLPVTVAINVAMRISIRKLRTILIDFESDRNAIANVFDIDTNASDKVADTCIDNLSIWTGHDLTVADDDYIRQIIENLTGNYDRVIVHAPGMSSIPQGKLLASLAIRAVIFGDSTPTESLFDKPSCSIRTMPPPSKAL